MPALILAMGTIPLHALVRHRPQDLGLYPDGVSIEPASVQHVSTGAAVRSQTFWWLALAFSLIV